MSIEKGQQAPEFSLFDTDKQLVNLADLRGRKLLLLFFPLAFSSVCTKELCSIRDNISAYNEVNATVLGISVDSLYVLNKFKKDQNLNFTLLSDFNKTVSAAYGALYEEFPPFNMKGVGKRAAFVIDRQGLVQYAEICPTPAELPDFVKIQQALRELV
jgi:peroxiredoxin